MSLGPHAGPAQTCSDQCQASSAGRAKDEAPTHSSFTVSLSSRPLIASAPGSVIYFGRCNDVQQWVQHMEQKKLESPHRTAIREEFYRRFLVALLRPLFPHLVHDLVQSFKGFSCNPHYAICLHLKHAQEPGLCCARTPSYGLATPTTFGTLLRRGVLTHVSHFLSVQAAQDLGFARLARLCHKERYGEDAAAGGATLGAGALWSCQKCQFPNEDNQTAACGSCGHERVQLAFGVVKHHLNGALDALDWALTAEAAAKKVRKLTKKLHQIKLLKEQFFSGTELHEDQIQKVLSESAVAGTLRILSRMHPGAFFAMADRYVQFSAEDIDEADFIRASQVCSWGQRPFPCASALADPFCDWDASFRVPLHRNVRRNAMVLFNCHNCDVEFAHAAASLVVLQPSVLLAKHALMEPIGRMMLSVQPQIARLATNTLIRHLQVDTLHRIAQSPLPPHLNFKIAVSELQRRQPHVAEMLTFQMHELNAASRGAFDRDPYNFDVPAALRDADVLEMAAVGELVNLPKWLRGLHCSSAINEASCIEVTCVAPTKVYVLCLRQGSHAQAVLAPPHCVSGADAVAWKFETSAKLFARYGGMQPDSADAQMFTKSAPEDCLVHSAMLGVGAHRLQTKDAVYFFDAHRYLKQQRLQAAGAELCRFMQSDGFCCAGDCCDYSHAPPRSYSPDVPAYIRSMLRLSQSLIQSALAARVADPLPSPQRARLYIKRKGYGFFAARRLVLPAALVAALVMRIIQPNTTKCQARALAACRRLPQRVYSGLMARADDFDDEDRAAFVERGGYRFRTLFKHPHSRRAHVLGSGAVFYAGGGERGEFGRRELPPGWEICPGDAISIAVCAQYTWQSAGLALADGRKHSTLGCLCSNCARCDAAGVPRQPHADGKDLFVRSGSGVVVSGTDVLIRRKTCIHHTLTTVAAAHAAPPQSKPRHEPECERMAAGDLAELLARCCLEQATPLQQRHIRDFLDRNKKT